MTVYLGYGRWRAGSVGNKMGFDAYGLRTSNALWHDWGAEIRKVPGTHELATTQNHDIMGDVLDTRRKLIVKANIEEYRKNPEVIQEGAEERPKLTLYPGFPTTATSGAWRST